MLGLDAVRTLALLLAPLLGCSPAPRARSTLRAIRVEQRALSARIDALEVSARGRASRIERLILEAARSRCGTDGPARDGPPAPASSLLGSLRVGASGFYCIVFVDGTAVGNTPVAHFAVRAGPHRVTCWDPRTGFLRTEHVDVEPGERVAVRFEHDVQPGDGETG